MTIMNELKTLDEIKALNEKHTQEFKRRNEVMENNFYWNSNGLEQDKYNEMLNAGWDEDMMLKASNGVFRSYYRYYNDGDLPGWARGDYHITKAVYEYGYSHRVLNGLGEKMLEDRVTETILKEYKRFKKAQERVVA